MSNNDDEIVTPNKNQSFNTTINVAHILTTIGAIWYVFSGFSDLKTTVITNTAEISHIKNERAKDAAELKESIKELNQKVDRLIERGQR